MKIYTLPQLFLSIILISSSSWVQAEVLQCSTLFSEARQSLSQYKADARERARHVVEPKFSNPQYEMMAAKTWNGVKGPELLQAMLPEGISFVDHALMGANEDGVVKTSAGSMVHLKAKIGNRATTIGVNINALKSNFNRDVKSLVRENADAVIVFVHGGGTKTTGHHVATSLMSWMNVRNVDVVSIDMPWHGEGARVSFESVKDLLEYLRTPIEKYIAPAGKPIILVGHSMGGLVADLYMRTYPNDKLVSAVVPLSTVADALPGGTSDEKIIQEALIAEKNKTNPNIPAAERDLGEWLARQNKISPTCGLFCQILMFGIDWQKPLGQGEQYLPSLYVIGEGDGLYQGYEKAFSEGVASFPKAELKIIDQRRDLKDKEGKLITIGHLIFDHRPRIDFAADLPEATKQSILNATIKEAEFNKLRVEGKIVMSADYKYEDIADPETFVLLKNFIGKIIGKPLERKPVENEPLELVLQAYANNLAFREFAKTFIFQNMRATEKAASLGQQLQSIQQELRKFGPIKKENHGKLTEDQQKELDMWNIRFAEVSTILSRKGLVKKEDETHYKWLEDQLKDLNSKVVSPLAAERKQLRTALIEKKSAMGRAEKVLAEHENFLTSTQLSPLAAAKERAFKLMMDQDAKVRDLTNAYLFAAYSNGKFAKNLFENIPAKTIAEFEKFEKAANLYQKILPQFESALIREAQAGRLSYTGDVARKSEIEKLVRESAQSVIQAAADTQSILERLDQLDKELTVHANKTFQIEKEMAQLSGVEYFVPENYTIQQILSQSLSSARENKGEISSLLQKIWAEWQKIWTIRVAESNESLY